MYDLRGKLDEIVDEFIEHNKTEKVKGFVTELTVYSLIKKRLDNLIMQDLNDKIIAIFGNGNATKELFYAIEIPENLICIIDRENRKPLFQELESVPVVCLEKINEYQPDVILIPSMVYEKEIKVELQKIGFKGEVVGVHSWIYKNVWPISKEFFQYKNFDKYRVINEMYLNFLKSGDTESFLCTIIGLLLIRDYVHALSFMQTYIKEKREKVQDIIELKRKIEKIFETVRNVIVNQKTKHVMMYVVDSLKQQEIVNMPLLHKISDENFSFETLVTQYCVTRGSVMTMLTGYQILENKLYERRNFSRNDGVLFPFLLQEGYSFHFFLDKRDYGYSNIDELQEKCTTENITELFFDGVCEMLRSEKNTFNYMHAISEMHAPFYNPLFEEKLFSYLSECSFEEYMKQYRSAQKYVDEIIWFYYHLVKSENVTQIIIGDHGISQEQSYWDKFSNRHLKLSVHRWNREMINPVCIIANSFLGKGKNDNIVCNYHLAELIRGILERTINTEELQNYDNQFIKLEMLPIYNVKRIKQLISNGNLEWTLGFVGIWTKKDVYIRLENGEERYYMHENPQNLIQEEAYQEEIAKYRNMLKDEKGLNKVLQLKRFAYHKMILQSDI